MNVSVTLKDEAIILFKTFQCAIFSTYCESFYGCELFNFTKPFFYDVKIVYFMAENYTLYFRLYPRTYNYIVSNLGNCIIGL